MPSRKIIPAKALQLVAPTNGRAVSETLHVDTLIQALKADFGVITDQRANNVRIALDDAIMSAPSWMRLTQPTCGRRFALFFAGCSVPRSWSR